MLNFPTLPSISSVSRYIPAPLKNHWKASIGIAFLALGALALAWKLNSAKKEPHPILDVKIEDLSFPNALLGQNIPKTTPEGVICWYFRDFCFAILAQLKAALQKPHHHVISFDKDTDIHKYRSAAMLCEKSYENATDAEKKESWLFQILNALKTKKYISDFEITADAVTINFNPPRSA